MSIHRRELACERHIIDICTETFRRHFNTFNEWYLHQPALANGMDGICVVSPDLLRHLLLGKERRRRSTKIFLTMKKDGYRK